MKRNSDISLAKSSNALLGAHISIAGGIEKSLYRGASIQCTAIQIFTHSNRSWGMPPIQDDEVAAFFTAQNITGITAIVVHASYLINLASPKQDVHKRSVTALRDEIVRCELLNIPYLVLHPGSALQDSKQHAIARIVESIITVFDSISHTHTMLLLENMAGQGAYIGSDITELAEIYAGVAHPKRLGFCIDTCHAFAAGYSFTTPHTYATFWDMCRTILGADTIRTIHINDSLGGIASHVDRHADIGAGNIGIDTFARLMHDPTLAHIPKIVETPHETLEDDKRNLDILRAL